MAARRVRAADQLRDDLTKVASGQAPSDEDVERIGALAARVDDVPWQDELLFATAHFAPGDGETGEQALAALAQLVLDDWANKRPEPRWRLRVPGDAKGLDARWLDESGLERAEAVRGALATGRLQDVAFGTHEGRLDLRGFVDPDIERYGRWWGSLQDGSGLVEHPAGIDAGNVDGVDFSGGRFDALSFDRKSVTNSRFDGVDFRDIRLWATTVTDSTFRGSRFGELPVLSGTSGWPRRRRCAFQRVDFTDANLSGVHLDHARLEDCDFSGARLTRAVIESDLIRCRFAGHLHDVSFIGRPWLMSRRLRLEDVDLSGAELHHVTFASVDLAAFRLPASPDVRIVPNWRCVHARLKAEFRGKTDDQVPLSVRLATFAEPGGLRKGGAMVVELGTIREDCTPDDMARLERLLDAAEAACR